MPEVSILMRSKNDIGYITDTLGMLFRQTFRDFELLNVDSGSTDGTFEAIRQVNPQVEQIRPEEYNPGRVLNAMAGRARGQLLVFLNSDATPATESWLENLTSPLRRDPKVAATFGRQVARPNAHPLVVRDYLATYGEWTAPAVCSRLTLGNDAWFHLFSLANAAVRRTCWQERPFSTRVQYSEDIEWAYWARRVGYRIEYAPDAVAVHSHNYTYREAWTRHFEEGRADAQIFRDGNGRSRSLLTHAALPYLSALARDLAFCWRRSCLAAFLHSPRVRYAQKFGRYSGYRTGIAERKR